jgi:MSHA biogenesis protein MshL
VIDILNETDRNVPRYGIATSATAQTSGSATASGSAQAATTAGGAAVQSQGQTSGQVASQAQRVTETYDVRESARVFVNPEAGVLFVRARAKQHALVQRYVDSVMAGAKKQVLIEATIAEVQLSNQYQRGIDWSIVRGNFQVGQASAGTPAAINTSAFVARYTSPGFNLAIRLLESFGDVRVLSSPSISVLNNQNAILKVVDNLVYFSVDAQQTASTTGGPGLATFKTEIRSVPVGLILSVVPQISEADAVTLNLRPTISRKVGDVADPNPALAQAGVSSLVPVIQTREMESLLRVQSDQIAVLGGLMQDQVNNTEDLIPGFREVPILGTIFGQRNDVTKKTELVIFLRETVIKDPSVDGDFERFRALLPGSDFFAKPNPGRYAPTIGPDGKPFSSQR